MTVVRPLVIATLLLVATLSVVAVARADLPNPSPGSIQACIADAIGSTTSPECTATLGCANGFTSTEPSPAPTSCNSDVQGALAACQAAQSPDGTPVPLCESLFGPESPFPCLAAAVAAQSDPTSCASNPVLDGILSALDSCQTGTSPAGAPPLCESLFSPDSVFTCVVEAVGGQNDPSPCANAPDVGPCPDGQTPSADSPCVPSTPPTDLPVCGVGQSFPDDSCLPASCTDPTTVQLCIADLGGSPPPTPTQCASPEIGVQPNCVDPAQGGVLPFCSPAAPLNADGCTPLPGVGGAGNCADPEPTNADPLWSTLCTLATRAGATLVAGPGADDDGRADFAAFSVPARIPPGSCVALGLPPTPNPGCVTGTTLVYIQLDFFYSPAGSTPSYAAAGALAALGFNVPVPGIMVGNPTTGAMLSNGVQAFLTGAYNGEPGHVGLSRASDGVCVVCFDSKQNRLAILAGPSEYGPASATPGMLKPSSTGLALDLDAINPTTSIEMGENSIIESGANAVATFLVLNVPALSNAAIPAGFPDGKPLDFSYIHLKWPGERGHQVDVLGVSKYSNLDDDPDTDLAELSCQQPTNPTNPAAYCADWDGDGRSNADEIAAGSDPLSPNIGLTLAFSAPTPAPAGEEAPYAAHFTYACQGTTRGNIVLEHSLDGTMWTTASPAFAASCGSGNGIGPAETNADPVNGKTVHYRLSAANTVGTVFTSSNDVQFNLLANSLPSPATNTFTVVRGPDGKDTYQITGVSADGEGSQTVGVVVSGYDFDAATTGIQNLVLVCTGPPTGQTCSKDFSLPAGASGFTATALISDSGGASRSYTAAVAAKPVVTDSPHLTFDDSSDVAETPYPDGTSDVDFHVNVVDADGHSSTDAGMGVTVHWRQGTGAFTDREMSPSCDFASAQFADSEVIDCALEADSKAANAGLDYFISLPALDSTKSVEYSFTGHDPTGNMAFIGPFVFTPAGMGTPSPDDLCDQPGQVFPDCYAGSLVCPGSDGVLADGCVPAACATGNPDNATECAVALACPLEFYLAVLAQDPAGALAYVPCVPILPPDALLTALCDGTVPSNPVSTLYCGPAPNPDLSQTPDPITWFIGGCNGAEDAIAIATGGDRAPGCNNLSDDPLLGPLVQAIRDAVDSADPNVLLNGLPGDNGSFRNADGHYAATSTPNGQNDMVEKYIASYNTSGSGATSRFTLHIYQTSGITPPSGEAVRVTLGDNAATDDRTELLVINDLGAWTCAYAIQPGAQLPAAILVGKGTDEASACRSRAQANSDLVLVASASGVAIVQSQNDGDASNDPVVIGVAFGTNLYDSVITVQGSPTVLGTRLGLIQGPDGSWHLPVTTNGCAPTGPAPTPACRTTNPTGPAAPGQDQSIPDASILNTLCDDPATQSFPDCLLFTPDPGVVCENAPLLPICTPECGDICPPPPACDPAMDPSCDSDGDGVPDRADQCPGVDDTDPAACPAPTPDPTLLDMLCMGTGSFPACFVPTSCPGPTEGDFPACAPAAPGADALCGTDDAPGPGADTPACGPLPQVPNPDVLCSDAPDAIVCSNGPGGPHGIFGLGKRLQLGPLTINL